MSSKRNYVYYDHTISLCNKCHRKIDAKIIFEDEKVYLAKSCKEHGFQKVLIADDVEYYKQIRNYNKASEYPLQPHTETKFGCPYEFSCINNNGFLHSYSGGIKFGSGVSFFCKG